MKTNQKIALVVVGVIMVSVIVFLCWNNAELKKQNEKAEQETEELRKRLTKQYKKSPNSLSQDIDQLIDRYCDNSEIVKTLKRAKTLYEEGYGEEAVKKLVVAVESELGAKYQKEESKRLGNLFKLIEWAKGFNLINDLQFHVMNLARAIRNGESHQPGFKDRNTSVHIGLSGSIEVLGLLAPTKLIEAKSPSVVID